MFFASGLVELQPSEDARCAQGWLVVSITARPGRPVRGTHLSQKERE
jgi:hypothetical protein